MRRLIEFSIYRAALSCTSSPQKGPTRKPSMARLPGLWRWVTSLPGAKHLGIYQKLTVKIIAMDRSRSFVDTMLKGAFAHMKHTHLFEASATGTLMTDVFEYRSPLGMVGRIADNLFLKDYMTKLLIN